MTPELINLIISDILFVAIAAGWVILLVAGIEPDKPLSGGIPGHLDPSQHEEPKPEGGLGHLGERVGWLVFGAVTLSLPLILVWIWNIHGA